MTYQAKSRDKAAISTTSISIGQRFGKLVVIESLGMRDFGIKSPKRKLFWLCRCDCGNTIELPSLRLNEKAGGATYRSCSECRQKTCIVCGDKYPFSRRYDFCDSPACCEFMSRYRGSKRRKERWANDVEWREKMLAEQREWRAKNPGHTLRWMNSLSIEERARVDEMRRQANTRYMERIKSDPELYKEHRARASENELGYRLRRAQAPLLEDAQKLQKKLEEND